MRNMEDSRYDLAVVDPPYGIGIAANPVRQAHEKKDWDNAIPPPEYFEELKRVSKEQIIWGGNYFLDYLGSSQSFVVWNKLQPENFSLAMGELAWSSFQKPAKIFTMRVVGGKEKTHPTQKPIELYEFIFRNFAKQGDRILDTHIGSGTIGIAVKNMNFRDNMELTLDGYEIDEDYYNNAYMRWYPNETKIDYGLFG